MTALPPITEQLLTLQRKLVNPDWQYSHDRGTYFAMSADDLRIVLGLVADRIGEVGAANERKHERA